MTHDALDLVRELLKPEAERFAGGGAVRRRAPAARSLPPVTRARGGLVPQHLAAGGQVTPATYTDWYEKLYGPYGPANPTALPAGPSAGSPMSPLYGSQFFNDGVANTSPSAQQASVGTPANSVAQGIADVMGIAAPAPMSAVVGIASAVNNMAGPTSVTAPGIGVVGPTSSNNVMADVAAVQAAVAQAQAQAVADAGKDSNPAMGTGLSAVGVGAGNPGESSQGGTAANAGNTGGTGTAPAGPGGPGTGAEGAPGDPSTGGVSTDAGSWARGGLVPEHLQQYAGGGGVTRRFFGKLLGGAAASAAEGDAAKVVAKPVKRRGDWVDFNEVPETELREWWQTNGLKELRDIGELDIEPDLVAKLFRVDQPIDQLRRIAKDMFYGDAIPNIQGAGAHWREREAVIESIDADRVKQLLSFFGDYRKPRPAEYRDWLPTLDDSPLAPWAREFDLPVGDPTQLAAQEAARAEQMRAADAARREQEAARRAAAEYAERLRLEKLEQRRLAQTQRAIQRGPQTATPAQRQSGLRSLDRTPNAERYDPLTGEYLGPAQDYGSGVPLAFRPAEAPWLQYGAVGSTEAKNTAKDFGVPFVPDMKQDPTYGRDLIDFLKRRPEPPVAQPADQGPDYNGIQELLKGLSIRKARGGFIPTHLRHLLGA